MKCESCKHQFCWVCLGEYYGYKHSKADNGAVCGQRPLAALGFCIVMAGSIYMKLLLCFSDILRWFGYTGTGYSEYVGDTTF